MINASSYILAAPATSQIKSAPTVFGSSAIIFIPVLILLPMILGLIW